MNHVVSQMSMLAKNCLNVPVVYHHIFVIHNVNNDHGDCTKQYAVGGRGPWLRYNLIGEGGILVGY